MVQFLLEMATMVGSPPCREPHLNTATLEQDTVHCHNCGAIVDYHYCAVCGQETKLHVPSAGEFLHEFITHYVALEGKLWQSLWLLLRKPGMLTAEYLAGRRARYIQPLRLYLTFSVLFFALFKWGGYEVASSEQPPPSVERHIPAAKRSDASEMAGVEILVTDKINRWNPKWAERIDKFDGLAPAPYAMFCLMPLFALYLKVLYLGTGRRYGEHLLFALHANAFAFLVVGLITAIPLGLVQALLWVWLTLYLPYAQWRQGVAERRRAGAVHGMVVAVLAAFGLAVVKFILCRVDLLRAVLLSRTLCP
jgi:hypothetical protein